MTSIPKTTTADNAIAWVQSRLAALRRQLRWWVSVHGLGRWLWVVLVILMADMVLDRFFKMDLPQRSIMLIVMVALAGYWLFRKVIKPLGRKVSDLGLLHEVERQHPALDQSLISSYQLAQERDLASRGVSPALAHSTVQTGLDRASSVDFTSIFNRQQTQRDALILVAGILAAVGLFVGSWTNDFLRTWSRRNLLLTGDRWPQATNLEIVGARDGKIVVPLGTDYRQLVRVTENSSVTNVDVTLEAEHAGNRTLQKMRPTGRESGREHVFIFHSIATPYRIRASGGDAITDWVELQLVEPPAVLQMELVEQLPAYTGRDPTPLSGSGPHRILDGSRVQVNLTTNKPVAACELKLDERSIASLEPIDETRTRFQTWLDKADGTLLGGKYSIGLIDDSALANIRDFHFVLRISEDKPPVVRARTLGISGLVVPRAVVPVEYSVEDDYGLTRLAFETAWVNDESSQKSEATFPVTTWPNRPPVAAAEEVAVLELERLKLTPGTSLRFALAADDHQQPAATGRSREFLIRVVSEEELRADLLRREIEQRKAFQQAYDAQMNLIAEVRQVAAIPNEGGTAEQIRERMQNALVNLFRSQRGIGTSVNLVAKRFEEFLVEVQNNRLDEETAKIDPERTIQNRFEREIIVPIRNMDNGPIADAARAIDLCRRHIDQSEPFRAAIGETLEIQEQILEQMRQILAAMESSETFQEMVNRLLEIKRIEESLRKQLDGKGNLKGIFDDSSK